MKRTLLIIAVAGVLSSVSAQIAPAESASSTGHTISGVLMDANCTAVKNRNQAASAANDVAVNHNGVTGANAQSTEGATARTLTERESTSARTHVGATNESTPAARRTLTERSNSAVRASDTSLADRTETHTANNAGANTSDLTRSRKSPEVTIISSTPAPDQPSAALTTGESPHTAPPQSGNLQSTSAVQGPGATSASSTGDRARRAEPESLTVSAPLATDRVSDSVAGGGPYQTVREKYKECVVKSSTAAFAIHSEGKLYILDSSGNQMIGEQMRNEAFRASMSDSSGTEKFMSVTVVGVPSGESLSINSVRK
ncbi:MAG: hypothetical protein H7Y20_06880 [Bryobacteraceae bacterium]|nr:hypothetical protein [Bryobacteraceae bacterium]